MPPADLTPPSPRSLLRETGHRPWPLPRRPWVMAMQWRDLLFMHWRVDPEALRRLLPGGLELETFDGAAWLGIVPFTMRGVRARWTPPVPGLHAFHELNVRTYVRTRADERPGVWFFSLDAASRPAVRAARATFHLPYFDARMSLERAASEQTRPDAPSDADPDRLRIRYTSARTHRNAPAARFQADYGPTSDVQPPSEPGTLEHFLTERYCLYAAAGRRLYRGQIHHRPWPLQRAWCDTAVNTMTEQIGLTPPDVPPLLHFARHLDVLAWWPRRVRAGA